MKKMLVITWLLILLTGVVALFWRNEWIYSLPTPVPANYRAVVTGTFISLPAATRFPVNKPVFLHFFNPDCPCSRFNIPYFSSLAKEYQQQVTFAIVLMSNKKYTEQEIQNRFHINVPVLTDTSLARACGVYSTPQAVIINSRRQLYYRGNYNKSRFCTNTQSNFAAIALNSLVNHTLPVSFAAEALEAYGCQLPNCIRK